MLPHEEKILIDVFKDEELDVFGIFKRRRLNKKQLRVKRINFNFYKTATKHLINCYGVEGAMPFLNVLFASVEESESNG